MLNPTIKGITMNEIDNIRASEVEIPEEKKSFWQEYKRKKLVKKVKRQIKRYKRNGYK